MIECGICSYNRATSQWELVSAPHVRIKLKRQFPSLKDYDKPAEPLKISNIDTNAADLVWLFERYPHRMVPAERSLLQATAWAYEAKVEECYEIQQGRLQLEPVPLARTLRDYQRIAVDLARTVKRLVVADDLGLGKTAVGIALAAMTRRCVVVCQTHLQKQWKREIGLFAPRLTVQIARTGKTEPLKGDVLIITYSKLHKWANHLAAWLTDGGAIAFDEAQELRHAGTDKYRAAKHVAAAAEFRVGLTGTPVYNYGGEAFNIVDLLDPGSLGTQTEFMAEWCESDGQHMIVKDPKAFGTYLRERNLMIRRTRQDVGRELPPMLKLAHEVQYDEHVMKRMEPHLCALARTILATGGDFNAKGQAARQLDLKLRQFTGIAKAPAVADFVANLVKNGEKVVLTGWHREVYTTWETIFKREGIPFWLYTGEESPSQKDKSVTGFIESEAPGVFIMSLRSGAGINGLQNVSRTIVHGELDWSPQVHQQCDGRLVRDGQASQVTCIYLVADGGSDPIISHLLGIKMEQGLGVTDPTIDMADVPKADTFEAQAEANRITQLARAYLAARGKAA